MIDLYELRAETVSFGRSSCNAFSFARLELLSSRHMQIEAKSDYSVINMTGKNGGYLNGRYIGKGQKAILKYGDEIRLPGITIIYFREFIFIISDVEFETNIICNFSKNYEELFLTEENRELFIPSPKSYLYIDNATIELAAPPEKREMENVNPLITVGPAFTMAIPMLVGVLVTTLFRGNATNQGIMYTGIITAVLSGLFGGFWGIQNIKNRQRECERNEIKRRRTYEEYVRKSEELIKDKYNKTINALCAMAPHISESICKGKDYRQVYGYSKRDKDAYNIRLGTGTEFFTVQINIPKEKYSQVEDELKELPHILKRKYREMKNVPICLDVQMRTPIGIICDNSSSLNQMIRLVVLSLAAKVSPNELGFVFLIINNDYRSIIDDAVILLPHVWGKDGHRIVTDINEVKRALSEKDSDMDWVIVTDSYIEIKPYAKEDSMFIVLAKDFYHLPGECRCIIQKDNQFCGYIEFTEGKSIRKSIDFDVVGKDDFAEGIYFLASLCENIDRENNNIPSNVSFEEVLMKSEINAPSIESIKNNWSKNDTYSDISIPLGIKYGNEICRLDFHEKQMGPHGLIAGMTGSGKSEILQTIILGLSIKYSPDDVGFFLIDYKGGGMAGLFEGLPHIMGSISNLSGAMIERAMVSISSENRRRQMRFNEAGVNNIYDYGRLYRAGIIQESMPHVFIIVDEFAELRKECPDFMRELISVARVGRSLGVHLILATQKPSGTVDDNILSNSRFRICLRVQDKQDSNEILHTYDAADIINPGRAILQVGNNEIYELFQGAYTMDLHIEDKKVRRLFNLDEHGKIINVEESQNVDETSLSHIVKQIIEVGEKLKKNNKGRLWLEPLEDYIFIEEYGEHYSNAIGVYDDPYNQRRGVVTYDIGVGHALILGGICTGKSTLLSSMVLSLIKNKSPDECYLYFIDFNSLGLIKYRESNMCGGCFYEDNEEDIGKLFRMLEKELSDRKRTALERKYLEPVSAKPPPIMIVFIDGIGSFREKTSGRFDQSLNNILKNGEASGIYLIISALSISTAELPARLFEHIKTVYTLSLSDRYKYQEALRVSSDKIISHKDTPGRGLIKLQDSVYEFQAIIPVSKYKWDDIDNTISRIIIEKNVLFQGITAKQVPVIPKQPTINDLISSVENAKMHFKPNCIPCGYKEESGEIYFINIALVSNVLVSGKGGSGKSNFLNIVGLMAKNNGFNVYEDENFSGENIVVSSHDFQCVFRVYEDSMSIEEGARIKEAAGKNPYVIHFGGNLDRQNVADFSYIPYLKQNIPKEVGRATVLRKSESEFYGEVIIPRFI